MSDAAPIPFADPETHEPVRLASEPELTALRAALREGRARYVGPGDAPTFDGAYLSARHAYLVIGGVPHFLVDERVELGGPLEAAT